MTSPKLSIVVPTLHRPASVDRLLASITNQDLPTDQFEVIIAMNLPDPEQEKRVKFWEQKLPIKGVSTGEKGLNKARNLGVRNAQGQIILIIDDDMEMTQTDLLSRHLKLHEDANIVAIGGSCALPDTTSLAALAYHVTGLSWLERYRAADGSIPYLLGGHASYKRSIFDEGNWFDEKLIFGSTENSFNLQIFRSGKKMRFAPELRPIHHNDVKLRQYVRKAFLQGSNSAKRKMDATAPKPHLKNEIAVKRTIKNEHVVFYKVPFIYFLLWVYDQTALIARADALGQPTSRPILNLIKRIGRLN